MVIFLYGPDGYRREARKRFYVAEFAKKYSEHGIGRVDLEPADGLAALDMAARSRSLFEPAKLILADGFSEMDATPKKFKTALEPFMKDKQLNILITAEKKPVKALEFLMQAPVTSAAFEHLEGAVWAKFLKEEAEAQGVDLEPAAMALLAKTYEKDSWGAVTELAKLSGARRRLTAADLAALGLEVAPDFFPLIQTLRSPRMGDRLAALARLEHDNEPAAKTFNIISALWTQKTPQFAAYDRAVKMGRMDYEEALADLAIS
jgi:DNA polymerase III delta subunit